MNDVFELTLTEMAHGGLAVGKQDGRAIFVPMGLPGERIAARIVRDKGRFAFAEVVAVLEPSEARVVPPCSYFGRCGGCHWQHIAYPAQLVFKRQVVSEQMRRLGGLPDAPVQRTLASPDPWRYRSHITLHRAPDGQPGFVELDDQTVIPIDLCHIIRPELLEMLTEAADASLMRTLHADDALRLQVGSDGGERMVAAQKRQKRNTEKARKERGPRSRGTEAKEQETEGGTWEARTPTDKVNYTIGDHVFQVSAGSFFQVNLPQAEKLVELALAGLALKRSDRVLDLYSGVGLFTAFLAERAAQVTAVEAYPPAVKDARTNLAGMDNVRIVEGTIEAALSALKEPAGLKGPYQAAVVDPPRAGMHPKALVGLVNHAPERIVYVSCDPATLARDSKLLSAAGYHLVNAQPMDMFPQTYHIETVAVFVHQKQT
jgi:23S rRNA (uracil1939-C5)-methyltransferase